jgi:hypothetical protein
MCAYRPCAVVDEVEALAKMKVVWDRVATDSFKELRDALTNLSSGQPGKEAVVRLLGFAAAYAVLPGAVTKSRRRRLREIPIPDALVTGLLSSDQDDDAHECCLLALMSWANFCRDKWQDDPPPWLGDFLDFRDEYTRSPVDRAYAFLVDPSLGTDVVLTGPSAERLFGLMLRMIHWRFIQSRSGPRSVTHDDILGRTLGLPEHGRPDLLFRTGWRVEGLASPPDFMALSLVGARDHHRMAELCGILKLGCTLTDCLPSPPVDNTVLAPQPIDLELSNLANELHFGTTDQDLLSTRRKPSLVAKTEVVTKELLPDSLFRNSLPMFVKLRPGKNAAAGIALMRVVSGLARHSITVDDLPELLTSSEVLDSLISDGTSSEAAAAADCVSAFCTGRSAVQRECVRKGIHETLVNRLTADDAMTADEAVRLLRGLLGVVYATDVRLPGNILKGALGHVTQRCVADSTLIDRLVLISISLLVFTIGDGADPTAFIEAFKVVGAVCLSPCARVVVEREGWRDSVTNAIDPPLWPLHVVPDAISTIFETALQCAPSPEERMGKGFYDRFPELLTWLWLAPPESEDAQRAPRDGMFAELLDMVCSVGIKATVARRILTLDEDEWETLINEGVVGTLESMLQSALDTDGLEPEAAGGELSRLKQLLVDPVVSLIEKMDAGYDGAIAHILARLKEDDPSALYGDVGDLLWWRRPLSDTMDRLVNTGKESPGRWVTVDNKSLWCHPTTMADKPTPEMLSNGDEVGLADANAFAAAVKLLERKGRLWYHGGDLSRISCYFELPDGHLADPHLTSGLQDLGQEGKMYLFPNSFDAILHAQRRYLEYKKKTPFGEAKGPVILIFDIPDAVLDAAKHIVFDEDASFKRAVCASRLSLDYPPKEAIAACEFRACLGGDDVATCAFDEKRRIDDNDWSMTWLARHAAPKRSSPDYKTFRLHSYDGTRGNSARRWLPRYIRRTCVWVTDNPMSGHLENTVDEGCWSAEGSAAEDGAAVDCAPAPDSRSSQPLGELEQEQHQVPVGATHTTQDTLGAAGDGGDQFDIVPDSMSGAGHQPPLQLPPLDSADARDSTHEARRSESDTPGGGADAAVAASTRSTPVDEALEKLRHGKCENDKHVHPRCRQKIQMAIRKSKLLDDLFTQYFVGAFYYDCEGFTAV